MEMLQATMSIEARGLDPESYRKIKKMSVRYILSKGDGLPPTTGGEGD